MFRRGSAVPSSMSFSSVADRYFPDADLWLAYRLRPISRGCESLAGRRLALHISALPAIRPMHYFQVDDPGVGRFLTPAASGRMYPRPPWQTWIKERAAATLPISGKPSIHALLMAQGREGIYAFCPPC